jgi:hypothetical protein
MYTVLGKERLFIKKPINRTKDSEFLFCQSQGSERNGTLQNENVKVYSATNGSNTQENK